MAAVRTALIPERRVTVWSIHVEQWFRCIDHVNCSVSSEVVAWWSRLEHIPWKAVSSGGTQKTIKIHRCPEMPESQGRFIYYHVTDIRDLSTERSVPREPNGNRLVMVLLYACLRALSTLRNFVLDRTSNTYLHIAYISALYIGRLIDRLFLFIS